jgi:hypothetical protein
MRWIGTVLSLPVVIVFLICCGSGSSDKSGKFNVADPVFVELSTNKWFHGEILSECSLGWKIKFDNGDIKCCETRFMVLDTIPSVNDIKLSTKVLVQRADQKFYPGIVTVISGGKYTVDFAEGDEVTVHLAQLRLK